MNNNKEVKIMFFGHGGSNNHGCEAILRSTIEILHKEFSNPYIALVSQNPDEDKQYKINSINKYIEHFKQIKLLTYDWAKIIINSRITKNNTALYEIMQNHIKKFIKEIDICISIGGDNYCYEKPYWLYALDKSIKKESKKLVLWGQSIDEKYIDKDMEHDLKNFDLITVRESISYELLKLRGIDKNLYLYPDTAFAMGKEELELPTGWVQGDMIGLNLSPLVMNYEKSAGIAFSSYCSLVRHILKTTDSCIALIPHVTWLNNNDMEPLIKLYNIFKDTGRVILIGAHYNAPQLKGFIARCRLFIGARTHATIAAYSTGVPTLVLGYSVKARGIARDLFGDEKDLVLPVQELVDKKQLIDAFESLNERNEELRTKLNEIMPSYIERSIQSGNHLQRLVR